MVKRERISESTEDLLRDLAILQKQFISYETAVDPSLEELIRNSLLAVGHLSQYKRQLFTSYSYMYIELF